MSVFEEASIESLAVPTISWCEVLSRGLIEEMTVLALSMGREQLQLVGFC